jgi:hypothetical protein
MKPLSARDQFNTAMLLLDQAREEAAALPPLAALRTGHELAQRARAVQAVIGARDFFVRVHGHAQRLGAALARYEQRRLQQVAGS